MLSQWLSEAVFDFECGRCRGVMSLDRKAIDNGVAVCQACGAVTDTSELREMLCLAEWEQSRHVPTSGRTGHVRRSLLH